MTKDVYSVRLSEDHRKMIFKLKEYYKKNEYMELSSSDIIIMALNKLYSEKILNSNNS